MEGVLVYRQPVKISTQAFMIVHVSSEHTVGPGNKKRAMSEPSSSKSLNGPDKTRNKNEDLPPNGAAFTVKIMRSDRSP